MASKQVMTGFVLALALAASPAGADDQHPRNRGNDHQRGQQSERAASPQRGESRERAVPRSGPPPQRYESRSGDQRREQPRAYEGSRSNDNRRYDAPRAVPRYNAPRYDAHRDYDHRAPYYGPRNYRIAPRIIRPSIVTVVPYRPYVYRPSWSLGVYYGSGGYYPYGYTPRAYYDPIPGQPYGGLRITGMPRDAQVFADGYYVGIVNDFDGVFQHLNLEAGPHQIEIQLPGGYDAPISFNVYIEAGRTVTYRADY